MNNSKNWLMRLGLGAGFLSIVAIVASMVAEPVWAQVRAAFVRDVDTPALAPVTLRADFTFASLNEQRLLATVPAGKRLVIDHVSYSSGGVSTDELVFAALRSPQFGPMRLLVEINRPHAAASPGFTLQDGSQPVQAYFEAGEEVWLTASHSTGGARTITLVATGHYVTP